MDLTYVEQEQSRSTNEYLMPNIVIVYREEQKEYKYIKWFLKDITKPYIGVAPLLKESPNRKGIFQASKSPSMVRFTPNICHKECGFLDGLNYCFFIGLLGLGLGLLSFSFIITLLLTNEWFRVFAILESLLTITCLITTVKQILLCFVLPFINKI